MRYLAILLLICNACYERIEINTQPPIVHPMEDVFETCQFVCGFVKIPIMCQGVRHVLKHKECNVIEQTFKSKWRNPKEYHTVENICTYDYFMQGPCVNYKN